MNEHEKALPAGGPAKPTQNAVKIYVISSRERLLLPLAFCFCLLLVNTLLWSGPTAGLTAAVCVWYGLLGLYLGRPLLNTWESRVLLAVNLALAATLALGSNWYFRAWNLLALLALLPVHAIGLSGGQFLPWWRPSMLWERLCLLLWGLFGHLGAALATAWPQKKDGAARRVLPLLLGAAGALALLAVLVPVLASADALFAAATADLRAFVSLHFTDAVWKALLASVMTPFLFGLLYSLRRPTPLKRTGAAARGGVDGLGFAIVLAAVAALYLLFLGVQSAGLFGGAEYLAQKGLSYAEWARSGFFQMVGVTVVNLTLLLAAVQWSRREGGAWRAVRLLSALLTAESLLLLLSAAWRMTLYVDVYGLSFKRCMTYWGMGMMSAFLLAAAWKVRRPDFRFCRVVFPLALAGWLVINCVPVDYLVAKDQVDRYLSGESGVLDAEYLLYDLSNDTRPSWSGWTETWSAQRMGTGTPSVRPACPSYWNSGGRRPEQTAPTGGPGASRPGWPAGAARKGAGHEALSAAGRLVPGACAGRNSLRQGGPDRPPGGGGGHCHPGNGRRCGDAPHGPGLDRRISPTSGRGRLHRHGERAGRAGPNRCGKGGAGHRRDAGLERSVRLRGGRHLLFGAALYGHLPGGRGTLDSSGG